MSLPVTDIMQVVATFKAETEALHHTIAEQRMEISRLHHRLGSRDREILELKRELKTVREKLSQYEKPVKDSHNSSIPPSQEPIGSSVLRRTVSLRKKSGRKSGGQPGHTGHTLERVPCPDRTMEHIPQYCRKCGSSLSDVPAQHLGARQVFDLPKIKLTVTEHRIYGRQCSCGCMNKETFPAEARAPACYGPNIRAMISCFHTIQCIPYERMNELFSDCFDVNFSQGSIRNILASMKKASGGMYEKIRERITQSPVVGADETGAHVGNRLDWIWGFQTDKLTYLYHAPSRVMSLK
jgi:transposase/uncharacterized coiled-coil protein SlyX